uniref:Uncharacterized protein n=1 Tax=mine drainage metagenome TaxID=410659 RepID=E6Q531_9ZZZZ
MVMRRNIFRPILASICITTHKPSLFPRTFRWSSTDEEFHYTRIGVHPRPGVDVLGKSPPQSKARRLDRQ